MIVNENIPTVEIWSTEIFSDVTEIHLIFVKFPLNSLSRKFEWVLFFLSKFKSGIFVFFIVFVIFTDQTEW